MKRLLPFLFTLAACVPTGTTPQQWASLRQCESGGNYQAVSRTGKYRGAWQFDQRTFNSVAPVGWVGVRPDQAPPVVQDAAAYELYRRRGASPWPHCGRYLP